VATLENMETQEAPELVSIREAAQLAGVSYVHVWRLVKRGEIEAVRVGNQSGPLRIDRREFLAWLYGPPKGVWPRSPLRSHRSSFDRRVTASGIVAGTFRERDF
jgi:excisionase family DNA binding protein